MFNLRAYICELLIGWSMDIQPKDYISSMDEAMKQERKGGYDAGMTDGYQRGFEGRD